MAHTFVEVWEGVVSIVAELDVLAGALPFSLGVLVAAVVHAAAAPVAAQLQCFEHRLVLHASGLWQPSCNPPRPATGFAELAWADPTRPYVRPEILADGQTEEIVLEGCRHPCVEAQEGIAFVANDCKCADSCACPPT